MSSTSKTGRGEEGGKKGRTTYHCHSLFLPPLDSPSSQRQPVVLQGEERENTAPGPQTHCPPWPFHSVVYAFDRLDEGEGKGGEKRKEITVHLLILRRRFPRLPPVFSLRPLTVAKVDEERKKEPTHASTVRAHAALPALLPSPDLRRRCRCSRRRRRGGKKKRKKKFGAGPAPQLTERCFFRYTPSQSSRRCRGPARRGGGGKRRKKKAQAPASAADGRQSRRSSHRSRVRGEGGEKGERGPYLPTGRRGSCSARPPSRPRNTPRCLPLCTRAARSRFVRGGGGTSPPGTQKEKRGNSRLAAWDLRTRRVTANIQNGPPDS